MPMSAERLSVWKSVLIMAVAFMILSACSLNAAAISSPTPAPQATAEALTPALWQDANSLMRGICFAAAVDAAGQVFVLRDAEALTRFYTLADESGLCSRAVRQAEWDFEALPIVVGGWSEGTGCAAQHELVLFDYDPVAATATLDLHFVVEGECPYTLIRPFWMGLALPVETEITLRLDPAD